MPSSPLAPRAALAASVLLLLGCPGSDGPTGPGDPILAVSPDTLIAIAEMGQGPGYGEVEIANVGGGTLSWSLTADPVLLFVSATSGSLAAGEAVNIAVGFNTEGLVALGPDRWYEGNIDVSGAGATHRVTAKLAITAPPTLSISPDSFLVEVEAGSPAADQHLVVRNDGDRAMNWAAAVDTSWITAVPASGSLAGRDSVVVTLALATGALASGTHRGAVAVTAAGVVGSPAAASVTVVVAPPQPPTVTPTALSGSQQVGMTGGADTLRIRNPGSRAMPWQGSSDAAWLTLSPTSGELAPGAEDAVVVTWATEDLPVGSHTGEISVVWSSDAAPVTVPVAFTVNAPSAAQLIHRWTFSETGGAGTVLVDDVGGAHGALVNVGGSDATVGRGEVQIAGGARSTSDYATLPAGLLSGLTHASIEIWATQKRSQTWGRIFDVGSSTGNGLLMTWNFGGNPASDRLEWKGPENAALDGVMAPYEMEKEHQIVLTVEKNGAGAGRTLVAVYRDGQKRGTMEVGNDLADLEDTDFWLGRSQYDHDPTATANYNEVRLYNGVLKANEVSARFSLGPEDDKPAQVAVSLSGTPWVVVGESRQLTGTVTSNKGSVSQALTWGSSAPSVASVTPNGLVYGLQAGTTTITARSQADPEASASMTVTVRAPVLVHKWTFNETGGAGTRLADVVSGASATIVNVGSLNASAANGRVTLQGGAKDAADYVALPDGIFDGMSDATIEVWASTHGVRAWGRIFDFGPSERDYIMMSWSRAADPNLDRVQWNSNGGAALRIDDTMAPYATGREYHIVMTIDEGGGSGGATLVKWYLDGVERGRAETYATLATLPRTSNWLGRSKYPDETANASYNEVRIHHGALTAAEVAASRTRGPDGGLATISVSVSGATSVGAGSTIQLSHVVTSSTGTVSQAVSWSSSATGVATVDANGVVRGVSPGTAVITAASQVEPSATGSLTVTVGAAAVVQATLFLPDDGRFWSFVGNNVFEGNYPGQPYAGPWSGWSGWPSQWGSGNLDAAFYHPGTKKIYLIKDGQYVQHSSTRGPDSAPQALTSWAPWPSAWGSGDVDAAVWYPGNNKLYLFKGNEYSRSSWGAAPDAGYPRAIAGNWVGWPSSWGAGGVDAVAYHAASGKFYLFKGGEYAVHSFNQSTDAGYPKAHEQFRFPKPTEARDLLKDFADMTTNWSTSTWDFGYPGSWAGAGSGGHLQGVARLSNNRWVLSHSRDDDPGILIEGTGSDFTFFSSKDWGSHPGGIQASGNVVAVAFTEPQEVRFFDFSTGRPVELPHLRVEDDDDGQPNSVGLTYNPVDGSYYIIIGDTPNASQTKKLPIWKSQRGKSLYDPSNSFTRMGTVSVLGSEQGMNLIFDGKTRQVYLITLYMPAGTDSQDNVAVLTHLDLGALVGTEKDRLDLENTDNIFSDPAFRWSAGTFLESSGRLNIMSTERCVDHSYLYVCQSIGGGVDYFIIKP